MKTKNLSKKLVLNKETVADLVHQDLKNVVGGISIPTRCESNCETLCCETVKCTIKVSVCICM